MYIYILKSPLVQYLHITTMLQLKEFQGTVRYFGGAIHKQRKGLQNSKGLQNETRNKDAIEKNVKGVL